MSLLGKGREVIITVLCPNGRRVKVKANQSTCIGQVIEEACVKHEYDHLNYNLKHLKRTLDPSSTLQYSNIPNHAQLELIDAPTPRKEGLVTVHLVTDTGLKFIKDFPSSVLLWDILIYHENNNHDNWSLPSQSSDMEPYIVYTMRKIARDELESVTLKLLGLYSGKCMMRYNVQSISNSGSISDVASNTTTMSKQVPSKLDELHSEILKPCKSEEIEMNIASCKDSIEKMDYASSDPQEFPTESTLSSESITLPSQETENKMVSSTNDSCSLPKDAMDCDILMEKESVQVSSHDSYEMRDSMRPNYEEAHSTTEQESLILAECSSSSVPLHENERTEREQQLETKIIPLSDHDSILFSLDDAPLTMESQESDDVFNLTMDEVRGLQREQIRVLRELEEAPLITQQMRQLENDTRLLSAMNRYPVTQIRICFPDRNVIQANFKPRSLVNEVMEFVRPLLSKPDQDFYLYMNFPRTILESKMNLVNAGCIPKARLYFGSNDNQLGSFLSHETLSKISSFSGASNMVIKSTQKKSNTINERTTSNTARLKTDTSSNEVKRSNTSKQKTPKWFKLGK